MRNKYDEQLEQLNIELIKIGSLCEQAINCAVEALFENDTQKAKEVDLLERKIDVCEKDIESLCLKLILQQQPVATDLRVISSAMKMISDMERIGDQASDIAEITAYINEFDKQKFGHIRQMSKEAINMVTKSIDSFVKKDLDLANDVIVNDDVVDELFTTVKNELIVNIEKDSVNGEYYLDLFMIAKYLERIADHATNIAEWVEFSITGKHRSM